VIPIQAGVCGDGSGIQFFAFCLRFSSVFSVTCHVAWDKAACLSPMHASVSVTKAQEAT
jgi:hypothetical protein